MAGLVRDQRGQIRGRMPGAVLSSALMILQPACLCFARALIEALWSSGPRGGWELGQWEGTRGDPAIPAGEPPGLRA